MNQKQDRVINDEMPDIEDMPNVFSHKKAKNEFFKGIGWIALQNVILGKIEPTKACDTLQALRKMADGKSEYAAVYDFLKNNNLLREEDDIDFTYYPNKYNSGVYNQRLRRSCVMPDRA